ncbi:Vacuolar protein sorting-associated protein 68 [Polyrhizophydium stewartii]|uniref:Vacuolar protein sorting-associated protein 68 n=1 Tax=Polyrhizophydium stewartii TaxID=2732419 RepID=A0ABR4N053_9FUNG|nr:hypothetical protein HK105_002530 [Polyrhizophydium stewartii]
MSRYLPLSAEGGSAPAPAGSGAATPLLGAGAGAGPAGLGIADSPPGSAGMSTAGHGRAPRFLSSLGGRRSPFYCGGVCVGCGDLVARSTAWMGPYKRQIVGYTAGALFTLGWWVFIDGVSFNATKVTNGVAVGFEDWLPGIISTISLIVVNLIDQETLNADDFAYSGHNVACKARACAFLGVTMALGALGGSLAVLSLKFIIPGIHGDAYYIGQTIALQNFLIFISSMVLWFGRNSQEEGAIAL